MLKWKLTIVEGPAAGKELTHFTMLGRSINGKLSEFSDGRASRLFLRSIGIAPDLSPEFFPDGRMTLPQSAVQNRTLQVEVFWNKQGTGPEERTFVNINRVIPAEPVGKLFDGVIVPASDPFAQGKTF